ncbi:hypothetical protein [Lutispora thermophila]|uniref:Uncharacterized protein n=1 Tax=Lutispora thermophila DSM 19022 TaxID=1122184 RepID=A0A1M6EFF3_9FIRM|nr:hypothetical protein [Lutispora thermophila]SHI84050.1 hypothetical protein SAMN02745176_01530 [Lutispora thermophila DSM 19022]
MRANTIEQYKVLEFIKKNFETDNILIELIDKSTVKVTDNKGDSLHLVYINGEVCWD